MAMPAPKVGFLVIGAQKAGTTALDHYLRQHPDIGMADVKEVHYFDDEAVFAGKPIDHAGYEAHFPGTKRIHGEVTPIYLYWSTCCERIHHYNPDMKLIAILRDPVDRAYSQWNMEFNRGDEHRDFRTAVEGELERIDDAPEEQHRVFSYLDRGFYSRQIERFLQAFARDQLLFIKYEQLRGDPFSALHRIFDHLGLPKAAVEPEPVELNRGNYPGQCDPAIRRRLNQVFAADVQRTSRLTGLDLSDWLRSGE